MRIIVALFVVSLFCGCTSKRTPPAKHSVGFNYLMTPFDVPDEMESNKRVEIILALNPEQEAMIAYKSRKIRFISIQSNHMTFPGVNDSNLDFIKAQFKNLMIQPTGCAFVDETLEQKKQEFARRYNEKLWYLIAYGELTP